MWEWDAVVSRLRSVTYLDVTTEEFWKLSKSQRDERKDVGFFIGGKTDKRTVLWRRLLTLDIDEPTATTLDDIRSWLKGKTYIIHSTCSSTKEKPRYRVIAPMDAQVAPDEYGALLRIIYRQVNLPLDAVTFDPNRVMFLPAAPKDAEYFFESKQGEALRTAELFETYPNWRDLSDINVPKNIKIQNPKFKAGLVGAFCAKFSIRAAMDLHLGEIWAKGQGGRYTLAGASTTNGGVIYEDTYLYSNHGSDRHAGRCHNAYDAVRLYKYGEGREGEAAMAAFCEGLGIKPDSGRPHRLTVDAMEDEHARIILNERLVVDKNGQLIKSIGNAECILQYDPDVAGVFGYDLFSDMPVLKSSPEWRSLDVRTTDEDCRNIQTYDEMTDTDESYLRYYFEQKYGFDSRPVLQDALNITNHKNSFHPIRDYLSTLEWDKIPRLERIFIDCFGVADTLYAREVGLKFFVGAVRRVFIPASKMDYIPVLVSEEGLGKSRFIRRMAKLWRSDTFYTFVGSKEAYEQLRGVWIMEIPELTGVQTRSTNNRKAFVTKGEDRYRSAYLRYTKTYKRQCVFIASSNDVIFLDDPSEEGRRWWGLMCSRDGVKIDVHSDEFLDLVDLYWAEAVHHYLDGVLPVLSPEAEQEARQLRALHKAEDSELGALEDYLNMPIPPDWYDQDTVAHVHYWEHGRPMWDGEPRDYICTPEVAREFFRYERKELGVVVGRKVADAIRRTGLFEQTGEKKRFGVYGSMMVWKRKPIKKTKK